ncbi:CYFIP-related Rac1 interactor B-like [Mya arenaria]|uniref:CYFIP-related Rac1 interactor B-like n=1 Tax=Mya arenaria TaxID=6604 RepID=UPI0022E8A83E|nr:CYFIP-related Rac1 interactor B-like [Mya arenaria]XP_052775271.1 CYFIP-related Rac1 interactor B-like [Mya arenaria]XP_052775272.1 CYFIP-related Rac1 interactor B-like [Mya arenaria]
MGNLLKILSSKDANRDDFYNVFVDFENCQPTESELSVYDKIQVVLDEAQKILDRLKKYTGAAEVIRNAIQNPRDDGMQDRAWTDVQPLVEELKKYYEFSLMLEINVPLLLDALCSKDMTAKEHLEGQQALFKQFAEILDFVLKFDDLKMTNPVIQNDFSYYRRTQSRRRMVTSDKKEVAEGVPHEIANRMSLFYAQATPMLKMLSDTTSTFVSLHKDLPVENTTDCLSTMANICRVMIENPGFCSRITNENTKLFCLRVMVGVIILYDHVHPVGAFAKSSGIDMKSSIKLLKEQKENGRQVEGLLNALRYTTKHLQEETTPKSVKQMLG